MSERDNGTPPPHHQVVAVKPLRWKGPDSSGEYHSLDGLWGYIIRAGHGKIWLTEVGNYFPTVEDAKAAAWEDYERRISAALTSQPAPAEQTVGGKALRLVVEYDDLLRKYTGPIAGMTSSDNAAIDAAYDKMVAAARAAIEAQPAPAERLVRGDIVNKITLWFFRDIFESNRLALFSLSGLRAEDLDTLAKQQKALRHILAAVAGRNGGNSE